MKLIPSNCFLDFFGILENAEQACAGKKMPWPPVTLPALAWRNARPRCFHGSLLHRSFHSDFHNTSGLGQSFAKSLADGLGLATFSVTSPAETNGKRIENEWKRRFPKGCCGDAGRLQSLSS